MSDYFSEYGKRFSEDPINGLIFLALAVFCVCMYKFVRSMDPVA